MKHLSVFLVMTLFFILSCDSEELVHPSIIGVWEGDRTIIRHPIDMPTEVDTTLYLFRYDFREDKKVIIEDMLRGNLAFIDTLHYEFDSETQDLSLIRGDFNELHPTLNMPVLAVRHFKITLLNDQELHILENTEPFDWGETTIIKVDNKLTKKR